jgi:membrane associated rhomboid family serine protease
MASHNYYHDNSHTYGGYDTNQDSSYYNSSRQALNSPLPPLPHDEGVSPVNNSKSPFGDHYATYSPSMQSLDQYPQQTRSHDPFSDSSAIPLESQDHFHNYNKPDEPKSPGMAERQPFPPYNGNSATRPENERRRDGWFKGKIPWAVYILSLVQIIVFIVEIIKNATLTHSPIEIHPTFNPMIGPSPYVLINMGARYVPCMREYPAPDGLTVAQINMPCPNTTTTDLPTCSLADLCGFGLNLTPKAGGSQPQPNQWFRFIFPIFLHGGIVHIGFNLLLQLTLGKDVERQIGTLRFVLVYFSAGIFGFVFGGNYAPNGLASTGCSGALFGLLAIVLLDLLYSWKTRRNPWRDLLFIALDVVVSFVLGLLPAIDNFSHIGGFLTGLVLGVCLLHSPDALRERIGLDEPPYATVAGAQQNNHGIQDFVKQPVGFFKGRKPLWWAWWLLRAGALVAVVVTFIVLLRNFYIYRNQCSWCKYLSCLVSVLFLFLLGN